MEVKNIIKNRRIELGLTMKDVASMVGVSEGTISRWESGDIENMRRDKISALASVLQISPMVIMGIEDPEVTNGAKYYLNDETAALAQEMLNDSDMRVLYDMKRNMDPDRFKAHVDFMKELYKQEHPDYDEGC
ncbi:MAG: helix-turn-helix transcriptional regulator [Lachnospiraceae bacterium]|nr:helix-turn-helix transcriptional regulator [Lachnospiraceae bacterium]